MNHLPEQWINALAEQPESGMGYWTGDVELKDGTVVRDVLVSEGRICEVRGHMEMPFEINQIARMIHTGKRWKWGE